MIYLLLGALWTWAAGASPLLMAWFVAVAIAGAFIPGEANQVSLARAYLAGPAFVYALAGLTDLVDGTVARRFGHPSNLGGGLDPVVDGLFVGDSTGLGAGVVWRKDDFIYAVGGPLTEAQVLAVANSLR